MAEIPRLAETPAALAALERASVLYTDLDGTLLGIGGSVLVDGDGHHSPRTAEAIARVNAAGLDVVVTTGRNRIQAAEIARLLGWRGFIAEIGCVIVPDRGESPIYFTGDWPEDAVAAGDTPFEMIERVGALGVLARAFPGRIEPHAPYHLDREATHVLRGLVDLEEAQGLLGELPLPVDLIDNGVIHPRDTDLVDLPEIHAYHLVPRGARKERAVAFDVARRGLTRADAVAVGDSASDVPMADETSLVALVANALDDARVPAAAAGRDNVYTLERKRGDGWADLAEVWMRARSCG
jgi:phosphoglycolate phosphatase